MHVSFRNLIPALGSLVLVFYACNVQPGGSEGSQAGSSEPTLSPETAQITPTPAATPAPEMIAPRPQPIAPMPAEAQPTGPMATEPTPLPKADQRVAIFHSSNVGGELDPCG